MEENKLCEFPYERIAINGGEMPDGLEWYDRQMFLQLRILYYQYKNGIIDRNTAKREKRKMVSDYEHQKWQSDLVKFVSSKIKATEQARQAYRKNRTLENADAIILAFEGVPVKLNGEAL